MIGLYFLTKALLAIHPAYVYSKFGWFSMTVIQIPLHFNVFKMKKGRYHNHLWKTASKAHEVLHRLKGIYHFSENGPLLRKDNNENDQLEISYSQVGLSYTLPRKKLLCNTVKGFHL